MNTWMVYAIGFTAQILFSARLLLQWISSEKNKKVVTPSSFWIHSLIASFLLFIYGDLRHDFAIMLGQTITYYIYIRNLQIRGEWFKLNFFFRWLLSLFPVLIIIYYFNNNTYDLAKLLSRDNIPTWLLILGIVAQVVFTFRFVAQWLYSEKIKQSVLPLSFWWLSLTGSSMILIYAIIRKDPVLFIGQIFGVVVYTRNIILMKKHEAE